MTALHRASEICCGSSAFDQPQKVSPGAGGGSGSRRAELSYCIESKGSF